MPHRLRSFSHIWGLPLLQGNDLRVCLAGNRMLRSAIRMIKKSVARGCSGFLENPLGALLWHVVKKVFQKELSSGCTCLVSTDMCCYGTKWKKPTRLLLWGRQASSVRLPRCTGRKGWCSTSKCKHEQLSSTVSCAYGVKHAV